METSRGLKSSAPRNVTLKVTAQLLVSGIQQVQSLGGGQDLKKRDKSHVCLHVFPCTRIRASALVEGGEALYSRTRSQCDQTHKACRQKSTCLKGHHEHSG